MTPSRIRAGVQSTPGRPTSRSAPARAFTLVEAICTIVVLALVMSVCARTILAAADGCLSAASRAEAQSDAAAAMDRLIAEIRSVGLVSGSTRTPNITQVRATGMTFTTTGGSRAINLSSGSLVLTVAGVDSTLVTGVTQFTIQTMDESGAALAASLDGSQCSAVQRVQISITVQRGATAESLRTLVFLRALVVGVTAP